MLPQGMLPLGWCCTRWVLVPPVAGPLRVYPMHPECHKDSSMCRLPSLLIPGESCATELSGSCSAGRGPGAAFPAWPRASRQLCCCCCPGSSALAPLQQDSALSWGTHGEMNLNVACAVLHVVWASSNQSRATQQWSRFQLSPSFGLKELVDFSLPWEKCVRTEILEYTASQSIQMCLSVALGLKSPQTAAVTIYWLSCISWQKYFPRKWAAAVWPLIKLLQCVLWTRHLHSQCSKRRMLAHPKSGRCVLHPPDSAVLPCVCSPTSPDAGLVCNGWTELEIGASNWLVMVEKLFLF